MLNNQGQFQTNSAVHSDNTKNKYHLHRATANLSCLPCGFTRLNNEKTQFKTEIRNMRSFYSAYNKHGVPFEYCM